MFNWLAPYLPGARVLDLFAGSGIMGLESLSRGASAVVAVERDRLVAERLRDAGRTLGAQGLDVLAADAVEVLSGFRGRPFDLVFLDPPYAAADYEALCELLEQGDAMTGNTLVYLEFPTPRALQFEAPASWERFSPGRCASSSSRGCTGSGGSAGSIAGWGPFR